MPARPLSGGPVAGQSPQWAFPPILPNLTRRAQETGLRMVVYHADRLQEGIDNGRADEAKPAPLEILRDPVAQRRARRDVRPPAWAIEQGLAVDEGPQVAVKGSVLAPY